MKTVFRKDDKVFCILRGWGTIINIGGDPNTRFPIKVTFMTDKPDAFYTLDGVLPYVGIPTLSFTEYTMEKPCQERIRKPYEVGDEVFDMDMGWGTVGRIIKGRGAFCLPVNFKTGVSTYYTIDGFRNYKNLTKYPSLSYTEYDLINGGFS